MYCVLYQFWCLFGASSVAFFFCIASCTGDERLKALFCIYSSLGYTKINIGLYNVFCQWWRNYKKNIIIINIIIEIIIIQTQKSILLFHSWSIWLWCVFPLVLSQALPPTTTTLSIYCTSVTVFFIVIKMVNYRLHLMFDQGDIVAQNSVPDISKGVDKKSNASDSCLPSLR